MNERKICHGRLYLTEAFSDKFIFNPSGTIIFKSGLIKEVGKILKENYNSKAVLIVTDKGIKNVGIVEEVITSFRKYQIPYVEFARVKSNPSCEVIEEGTKLAKQKRCEIILGLGGGSCIDTAKGIGVLMTNEGSIKDYNGSDKIQKSPLPIVAIPTTSGTGSEVTPWIIISDLQKNTKFAIADTYVIPSLAILDPMLTICLPPHITAGTGMDALTHAIESYVNTCNQPISESLAMEAIKLIGANLRQAVFNGKNIKIRENMMIASLLAGLAFSNAMTGIVHALSLPCTALFHTPHGFTNAAILAAAMKFSYMANPEKFALIAKGLGKNIKGLAVLKAAELSIEAVRELSEDIEIPTLSELGVKEEKIPVLAEMATFSKGLDVSPRLSTKEDRIKILKESM